MDKPDPEEKYTPPPYPLEALRGEYLKRERFTKKYLPIFAGVFGIILLLSCCVSERMGSLPDRREKKNFAKFPNYSAKEGKFLNEEKVIMRLPEGAKGKWGLFRFIFSSGNAPEKEFAMVFPAKQDFPEKKDDFSVRWLGHSTLLIEMGGVRLMTDPVFGNAAPIPGVLRRYTRPPIPLKELPELDLVLISHDHYDHLEYSFIREMRYKNVMFLCPCGVGARLRSWGIAEKNIKEINWGESFVFKNLKITSTPGRHFSGRSWSDRDATLWSSYILEASGKKFFFGGDSGYGRHFAAIGEKYGPFDLVAMEIDAWNEKWPNNHIFPHEVPRAVKELKGKLFLPIHWGVFDMADHKWDLSIEMIRREWEKSPGIAPLVTPLMGEKFFPAAPPAPRFWWKKM